MTNKVGIDDLSKAITSELTRYSNIVKDDFEESKKNHASELVKDLKQASPRRNVKNRRKYAEGWRAKKEKDGYIIHNATNYQLTHLLEKGHVKRNGGRVSGQPHIAPAEDKTIKNFLDDIERMVKE